MRRWLEVLAVVTCGAALAVGACGGASAMDGAASDDGGPGGDGVTPGGPDDPNANAGGGAADDDGGTNGDAAAPFDWPAAGPDCKTPGTLLRLSQTCLYEDIKTKKIRADVVEYEPTYKLWTDGAKKRRFIWLPPGTTIDTSNMDDWEVPVGTRIWKEFTLGTTLLETRLIERTGASSYRVMTFVWRGDGSDADANLLGAKNVNGTEHDVPARNICGTCHNGSPGKVLGFSAVQLSRREAGVTLDALVRNKKLSKPPPTNTIYPVPGNAVESAALGYLHANCGHCHRPGGDAAKLVDLTFRLDVATVALGDPTKTKAYTTGVGQKTTALLHKQSDTRIKAGSPQESDVWLRMGIRESYPLPPNMPPYGTEKVDPTGRGAVEAWIKSL